MTMANVLKSFWKLLLALVAAGAVGSVIQLSGLGLEWRLVLVALVDVCLIVAVVQLLRRWAKPAAAASPRPNIILSTGAAALLAVLAGVASFYFAHAVIAQTAVRIIESPTAGGNHLEIFGSNAIVQASVPVPPKATCRTYDIAGWDRAASLKVNAGGPAPSYQIQGLVRPQAIIVDCGANTLSDQRVQVTPADAQVLRTAGVGTLNGTIWIVGGIIWLIGVFLSWLSFR
ncbi:hypothetical protein RNI52_11430 [Labrys neptuniae]|uniref:hypothetical protein n=1 Tax=Labrys TaxID=204476 RepID=UPI002891D553|nr:hypothetical protein [Labrys neptuniae]MDT3377929.1 hypothetical protein [Labrys neptuniae]